MQNLDASCVLNWRADVDYFPQKTSFRHSVQLQVEYARHYKRVLFMPSVTTGEQLEFLLVQCGTPVPPHGPHTQVIQIPVHRLVTGNSAMLGALDQLGLVDRLRGSESTRAATVPAVRERIEQGLVQEMSGYGHASIEPVIAVQADVFLSFYSAYPEGNVHPRLRELGVRAVPQADHHETHPLGRAEWIKLLALLTNREAQAERQFAPVEAEYLRLAALVHGVASRPLVMAGFASGKDSFEIFGGRNHRAQLIRDAGGRYVLDADPRSARKTSSLIYVPFETVYALGHDASYWLDAAGGKATTRELIDANPLNGWFAATRSGNVYAWDLGYIGAWASPYRDQSMNAPDVLLAEAIAALHPELAVLVGAGRPNQFLRRLQ